jgi:hypothetical protein
MDNLYTFFTKMKRYSFKSVNTNTSQVNDIKLLLPTNNMIKPPNNVIKSYLLEHL